MFFQRLLQLLLRLRDLGLSAFARCRVAFGSCRSLAPALEHARTSSICIERPEAAERAPIGSDWLHCSTSELLWGGFSTNDMRGSLTPTFMPGLRAVPRWPLVPRSLRRPHGHLACGCRLLQSAPSSHSALPPPCGLVDFIGFDGAGYIVDEPPSDYPKERLSWWRGREIEAKKAALTTMQHPSYQPLITIVNEVELELAGVLLDTVREFVVGTPRLGGGFWYADQLTGDGLSPRSSKFWECYRGPQNELHRRGTLCMGSPAFHTVLKGPVREERESFDHKGRSLGMHTIQVSEAQSDYRDATEAELDQVVCTSPYFKLSHDRHGEFQPEGSTLPAHGRDSQRD